MNKDISTSVGATLLIELIKASKQGNTAFKQLGIEPDTMNDLATMNISELYAVADTPFVDYKINNRSLNLTVQRILRSRNRDDLLNSAIKHGASRTVMKKFAHMSYKEFNTRRAELNLSGNRNRPSSLNDDEYTELADLHSQYGQKYPFKEKLDHLRCLLFLSERISIDINRIYEYFYCENETLFLTEVI